MFHMRGITTPQVVIALVAIAVVVVGAVLLAQKNQQPEEESATPQEQETIGGLSLGKDKITIGIPPWPGATVKSAVAAQALQEMGYETEIKKVDVGVVYSGLADKQIDVNVAGWLPTTHQQYWEQYGDRLEIAGINVTMTWLGLGVPAYTSEKVQSIPDLTNEEAASFAQAVDTTITGIEPGAGIMMSTEEAMDTYELKDGGWTLQQSSASAMLSALQGSMDNEEPIVATVWQPHAAFAVGDLRKLDDPENVYNDPEKTRSFLEDNAPEYADAEVKSDVLANVVYKGFAEDAPAANAFFENFQIDSSVQSNWILRYSVQDEEADTIAQTWIENNRDMVNQWIPGNTGSE